MCIRDRNSLVTYSRFKSLYNDSKELRHLYSPSYPVLRLNQEGESSCTSCTLCEKICPTSALKIKSLGNKRLISGDLPEEFELDLELCNKCDLCRVVCPVDALSLRGEFESTRKSVDLIEHYLERKVPLA